MGLSEVIQDIADGQTVSAMNAAIDSRKAAAEVNIHVVVAFIV
jgi:hypothetical protein